MEKIDLGTTQDLIKDTLVAGHESKMMCEKGGLAIFEITFALQEEILKTMILKKYPQKK